MKASQIMPIIKARKSSIAIAFVMLVFLVGCVHKPPTPDLPTGPVIEYGRPGVVR